MANFKIISNNPLVSAKYPELTFFNDTSVECIFICCRDLIHKGAVLINHPLSGSVKPNVSPYKSIVISNEKPQLDFFSLQLIESALETLKKLGVRKNDNYPENVIEDFQVIDLDLLDSAMKALPPEFNQ